MNIVHRHPQGERNHLIQAARQKKKITTSRKEKKRKEKKKNGICKTRTNKPRSNLCRAREIEGMHAVDNIINILLEQLRDSRAERDIEAGSFVRRNHLTGRMAVGQLGQMRLRCLHLNDDVLFGIVG